MTVCIAAIATENNAEYIVFATDHMITTRLGQYEHPIEKYCHVKKNMIAMLSGRVLLTDKLLPKDEYADSLSFEEIQQDIFSRFKQVRKEEIQRSILDIYGVDETFIKNNLMIQIQNRYIDTLFSKISQYRLNTSVLLIGYDKNNKAQISMISEDTCENYRDINFHAIGSGSLQATNTLMFQKHDKKNPLSISLYNVFKAKRNAEVAQGVGKELDLLVLSDSKCIRVSPEELKYLDKVYNEEMSIANNSKDLKKVSENILDKVMNKTGDHDDLQQ